MEGLSQAQNNDSLRTDEYRRMKIAVRESLLAAYHRVAFMKLNEISPGLGDREINILDLVVPLRSDITVSAQVGELGIEKILLHHVDATQKPFAVIDGSGDLLQPDDSKRAKLNNDFIRCVHEGAKKALVGRNVIGLSMSERRLIFTPLWMPGRKEEFASIEVLSAANAFQHVVILGNPGSGKTTAARAIAAAHYSSLLQIEGTAGVSQLGLWGDLGYLPLYIELKSLVSDEIFQAAGNKPGYSLIKEYIRKSIFQDNDEGMKYAAELLADGRAILILDGLDEIPVPTKGESGLDERREQLRALIGSIKVVWPHVKIVVTSRPAGYSGWTLEGFEVLHIMPLSTNEAKYLARSCLSVSGQEGERLSELTDSLWREIDKLPRQIREYPLFICLLASLHTDTEGAFPSKRGGLLQVSLDTLLGSWTVRRNGGKSLQDILQCEPNQIIECLAKMSLRVLSSKEMYDSTDTPDVPLGIALEEFHELGEDVNLNHVLNYITEQAGILTSPAHRRLRFVHRLFQEYLAALAVSRDDQSVNKMAALLKDNPMLWREVALLFSDILSNEKKTGDLLLLVESLLNTDKDSADYSELIAIAARIIVDEEFSEVFSQAAYYASIRSCVDHLMKCLASERLSGEQKALVGRALDELGDPREGISVGKDGVPRFLWEEIRGGSFNMGLGENDRSHVADIAGSREWDLKREQPQHSVAIGSFCISRYPVTHRQFQAFIMADDGYGNDKWWTDGGLAWRAGSSPPSADLPGNVPQNCVTWYEAVAFCRWCSARTGMTVRLPTEAEWEYVARGTVGQTQFVWGDSCDTAQANVAQTKIGGMSAVGCFPASDRNDGQYNVCDMNGNVWEWCSSIVEKSGGREFAYPYDENDGREELEGDDLCLRATRGGYYDGEWMYARSCYRGRDAPSLRADRQGFRVVKEVG